VQRRAVERVEGHNTGPQNTIEIEKLIGGISYEMSDDLLIGTLTQELQEARNSLDAVSQKANELETEYNANVGERDRLKQAADDHNKISKELEDIKKAIEVERSIQLQKIEVTYVWMIVCGVSRSLYLIIPGYAGDRCR
jgi:tetrahydromethanopterin S-methyltransferase subunit G